MEKNSLTALDFVISVLREHERDLTVLSDRLEETLKSVAGKGVRRSLTEISSSIEVLAKEVRGLRAKLAASEVIAVSTKEIIESLEKQTSIQNQNIRRLSKLLKEAPNRVEVEELHGRVVTLMHLLNKINVGGKAEKRSGEKVKHTPQRLDR